MAHKVKLEEERETEDKVLNEGALKMLSSSEMLKEGEKFSGLIGKDAA